MMNHLKYLFYCTIHSNNKMHKLSLPVKPSGHLHANVETGYIGRKSTVSLPMNPDAFPNLSTVRHCSKLRQGSRTQRLSSNGNTYMYIKTITTQYYITHFKLNNYSNTISQQFISVHLCLHTLISTVAFHVNVLIEVHIHNNIYANQ